MPFAMLGEAFGNSVLNEPRFTLLTLPFCRVGVPSSAMYKITAKERHADDADAIFQY